MRKSASAFTIVELLIVIVVIAILAAISIVAYNGIQARAYDSTIQNDLASFGKKMELYNAEASEYPSSQLHLESLAIKASKSAYAVTGTAYNLLACRVSGGTNTYALLALSKSGKKYYISNSSGGVKEYTGATSWSTNDGNGICSTILSSSVAISAGYRSDDTTTGPWRAWTGGN